MDPTQPTIQPNLNQPEPQEHILNKLLKVMLILLILISIGLGGFIFLQLSKKESTDITVPSLMVSPTAGAKNAISPTVQPEEDPNDINIGSVESDLKDIEDDIKDLQ